MSKMTIYLLHIHTWSWYTCLFALHQSHANVLEFPSTSGQFPRQFELRRTTPKIKNTTSDIGTASTATNQIAWLRAFETLWRMLWQLEPRLVGTEYSSQTLATHSWWGAGRSTYTGIILLTFGREKPGMSCETFKMQGYITGIIEIGLTSFQVIKKRLLVAAAKALVENAHEDIHIDIIKVCPVQTLHWNALKRFGANEYFR